MDIVKILELIGSSPNNSEDATMNALQKPQKPLEASNLLKQRNAHPKYQTAK